MILKLFVEKSYDFKSYLIFRNKFKIFNRKFPKQNPVKNLITYENRML